MVDTLVSLSPSSKDGEKALQFLALITSAPSLHLAYACVHAGNDELTYHYHRLVSWSTTAWITRAGVTVYVWQYVCDWIWMALSNICSYATNSHGGKPIISSLQQSVVNVFTGGICMYNYPVLLRANPRTFLKTIALLGTTLSFSREPSRLRWSWWIHAIIYRFPN